MIIRRDYIGINSLYYWTKDPSVQGRTVLELLKLGVPRKLSREGFWSYMLCGAVQEPFTLIEDVYSLPPGCQLGDAVHEEHGEHEEGEGVCEASPCSQCSPRTKSEAAHGEHVEGECEASPCSSCSPWKKPNYPWTRESAQEAVTAAVEVSVRETLERNSGTLCAFLSGGIDSGALADKTLTGMYAADASLFHDGKPLPEREKKIIYVGRLNARKNVLRLVRAFQSLSPRFSGWSLDLYGAGPLKSELESLTTNHDPLPTTHYPLPTSYGGVMV